MNKTLQYLTNEELVMVHNTSAKLVKNANITVPRMQIPQSPEFDKFIELLSIDFLWDHILRPIEVINIDKDIQSEMANRWLETQTAIIDVKKAV